MIAQQKALLKLINKVARNDVSDAINNILDAVSTHLDKKPEEQSEMYQMTLNVLQSSNERLWFNICLKLAKIYLDSAKYEPLDKLIEELKDNCRLKDAPGQWDTSKGTLLLEAFAIEI